MILGIGLWTFLRAVLFGSAAIALDDLPSGPDCGGMARDVEVEEFAAVMPQDDEDEEEAEGDGGDKEEVDGHHVAKVGRQKGPPRRGGAPRGSAHVLGDRELGDVVPEEGKFGLDPPPAPRGVLAGHAADELAEFGVERRAADPVRPGLPPPVELETLAVPGQDRGGLDDGQAGPPTGPDVGQPDPEDPVPSSEPWSGDGALQDRELMAQGHVLEVVREV